MSVNGYRAEDVICFGPLCTTQYYDFLEASYQSGLGSSENYFGILGLALGGPSNNNDGDSDGMGTSFMDDVIQNGQLLAKNKKFTFFFNKD